MPIAVVILAGLFALQQPRHAAHRLDLRPGHALWFVTIAALGISRHRSAIRRRCWALNPLYIVAFFAHHGFAGIAIFGAIVLCVSGVEALYADMSHFGRGPIALAWTAVVFPALALNYLGQGALVLSDPRRLDNPFYRLPRRGFSTPLSRSRRSRRSSLRRR